MHLMLTSVHCVRLCSAIITKLLAATSLEDASKSGSDAVKSGEDAAAAAIAAEDAAAAAIAAEEEAAKTTA